MTPSTYELSTNDVVAGLILRNTESIAVSFWRTIKQLVESSITSLAFVIFSPEKGRGSVELSNFESDRQWFNVY